jgi:hypothetical protein
MKVKMGQGLATPTTPVICRADAGVARSPWRTLNPLKPAEGPSTALLSNAIQELKVFVDDLAKKVERLVAQVTGHAAAIEERKAANDNLRLELKAANDSHAAEIQQPKTEIQSLKAAIKR